MFPIVAANVSIFAFVPLLAWKIERAHTAESRELFILIRLLFFQVPSAHGCSHTLTPLRLFSLCWCTICQRSEEGFAGDQHGAHIILLRSRDTDVRYRHCRAQGSVCMLGPLWLLEPFDRGPSRPCRCLPYRSTRTEWELIGSARRLSAAATRHCWALAVCHRRCALL